LFGLNISRTPSDNQKSKTEIQKSAGSEWLRGNDIETTSSVLTNAYEQSIWVYRAINVLAEQIANIPFLFSRGERGRETLITRGPLLDFYNHPHPHLNRFQYWELRVIWLMLRGECFRIPIVESSSLAAPELPSVGGSAPSLSQSSIQNRKSKIKNVLFLDPAHMHAIIENHELIGWRYLASGRLAPLDSQLFLPEEVWFEKLPNPFDFWRGLSPLLVADQAARTDFAASAFMRGTIENNADTGLIVRSDQILGDDQREQVIATLRNRKRKAGTPDRPIFLWGVNEIIKPELSSSDLQFLENRKFSRSEICAAFGVPEEVVTTTDKAKYDVMQGARLNFIENRIAPLCARLEAAEDPTVKAIDSNAVGWFDIDSLPIMQEARRSRLVAAKNGFDMGIPFNELNRVFDLGFKSFPWGDTGYLSSKLQTAGSLAEAPATPKHLSEGGSNKLTPADTLPEKSSK
jgi:phage portal protein BeeE